MGHARDIALLLSALMIIMFVVRLSHPNMTSYQEHLIRR